MRPLDCGFHIDSDSTDPSNVIDELTDVVSSVVLYCEDIETPYMTIKNNPNSNIWGQ